MWSASLNDVSCFCLATDVQKQLDSVAPQTGPRLMICDSFNKQGYEQLSCSHYISRNRCCFSRGFDFALYPLLIDTLQQRGPPVTYKWVEQYCEGSRLCPERAGGWTTGCNSNGAGKNNILMTSLLLSPQMLRHQWKPRSIYIVYIDGWLLRLLPMPVV